MIDASLPVLKQLGVEKRVTTMVGDFFNPKTLPQKQDIYILCQMWLNWSNDDACKILNNCAEVMGSNSKLLVIDFYIPDKNHPHYKRSLLSDAALLTLVDSSNRTIPEWTNLIDRSNLRINKIYTDDVNSSSTKYEPIIPLCVIEAVVK
ncbi:MAG TPA: methyltransferase [Aquella sp.]|nr:methyltransferase [Aquella sp.]